MSALQPAVLVADLVESVRLLEQAPERVIPRWERLVAQTRAQWLPQFGGRLVKSLGDGLLITFGDARQALRFAETLLGALPALNADLPASECLQLRLGLHLTDWVEGELDIYGAGVNLCVRLSALAQPQSLVMAAESLQAVGLALPERWRLDDLGRCYLKHVAQPVHCLQLRPAQAARSAVQPPWSALRPRLAVLPITCQPEATLPPGAAEVLRDDLVRALAANPHWQVLSRLSTQALHHAADLSNEGSQTALWVHTQLGGDPSGAQLDLRLLDGEQELWSGHFELPWTRLLQAQGGLMARITTAMDQALLRQGTLALHEAALPNIPSYSLLLRAVQALHRLRPEAMAQARSMLEHLAERHPRSSDVQAWLAKWHFVQLSQVMAPDPDNAAQWARHAARRALDHEPANGMALAMQGQLSVFHDRDCDTGMRALRSAAQAAPNEPLAWMYLANVQAVLDEPDAALRSYQQAAALAPLDPLGSELDLMGSVVLDAAGRSSEALSLARRSVERSPMHLSGRTQLIICLVRNALMDEARNQARAYVDLRPKASVQRYIDQNFAAGRPWLQRQAEALLQAGMPL